MDWRSRHALAWRSSNIVDVKFFAEALTEGLSKIRAEVCDTGQGARLTSEASTGLLRPASKARDTFSFFANDWPLTDAYSGENTTYNMAIWRPSLRPPTNSDWR